jgi:hypothetical protein
MKTKQNKRGGNSTKTKGRVKKTIHAAIEVDIQDPDKPKGKPRGRPFEKGNPYVFQPGNTLGQGRPRGKCKKISEAYQAQIEDVVPEEMRNALGFTGEMTWAELIALGVVREAAAGNVPAAKEIRETLEGKTPEKLEHTGKDGQPLAGPSFNVMFRKPGEVDADEAADSDVDDSGDSPADDPDSDSPA